MRNKRISIIRQIVCKLWNMQIEDLHITDEWAIDPVRSVTFLIARLIRNEEQAFFLPLFENQGPTV